MAGKARSSVSATVDIVPAPPKQKAPEAAHDAQEERRVALRELRLQSLDSAGQHLDLRILRFCLALKAAQRLTSGPAWFGGQIVYPSVHQTSVSTLTAPVPHCQSFTLQLALHEYHMLCWVDTKVRKGRHPQDASNTSAMPHVCARRKGAFSA